MKKKKMLAGVAVVLAVCCVAGGYVAIQNQRKVEAVNALLQRNCPRLRISKSQREEVCPT